VRNKGGDRERIEAELTESAEPLSDRAAIGSPAEVAHSIVSFGRAGATTIALQPTAIDPDTAGTIRLAAQARTLLRGGSNSP